MKLFFVCLFLGHCTAVYISQESQKCFNVLGVSHANSVASIKARYRQLALLHHPDRIKSVSQLQSRNEASADNEPSMEEINNAYECVTRFFARAEEPTLSKRAETIVEAVQELWESIAEKSREDLVALVNEYCSSEDLMYDVSFLVRKFFMNNDPDALQHLLALMMGAFLVNIMLCTIGACALMYGTYRVVRWVVSLAWCVIKFAFSRVYRLCFGPTAAKND